ncbi:MAG TPA: hypothetical protein VJ725_25180 [Thermoanaerobaculia bacterium]|nr:hypothetical protein [Thermoanaerobaculia bacterium]
MADEDSLRKLEERLTRIEAALAQQQPGVGGFTAPGGAVVDPAPFPVYGRWGQYRWPHPVVDPGPWPQPVVDPLPWPQPQPVVDPAPRPPFQTGGGATVFGRIGHVADPPPPDLGRLNVSQLEAALHSINAEKARLSSLEGLINQHLERAKKQG